ncbi:long-chain-acyl-CoA synthetase [Kineobactrum salinum]|uniref:Long-chain-acyl-CoA synthetase n=1 Tax=Kineobactrum salinum TaxID=2708301 RepID=A0A6C0U152_9GAMM|nr:long-chain-acyl-CoA synthetase [Kineobactrum salinum]QIB65513.1 long-chain-acyl-CoA synthetase [Kineobactrum salinum]
MRNNLISRRSVAWRMARALVAQPGFYSGLKKAAKTDMALQMSLGRRLEEWACLTPEAVAIRFRGKQWTYAQYNETANQYASFLASLGVGPNDHVGVNIGNRPEMLFTLAAVAKLGAVSALINTTQRSDVLENSLNLAKAKLLIVGAEQVACMETVASLLQEQYDGKLLWVAENANSLLPGGYVDMQKEVATCSGENRPETQQVTLRDPAFLVFTSGTTGMPKASVLRWVRWYTSALAFGQAGLNLTSEDTVYCCLPLYHNNALILNFGSALYAGATFALSQKFSASRFWDEVRETEATCFTYIGELLRYLMNQPPSARDREHKVSRIAGNGLRPDLWHQFKTRYGINRIVEFYGASESPLAFINFFNYDETVGWAPGGWEIVDYDVDTDAPRRDGNGHMIKLGPGKTGLLICAVNKDRPFEGYTDKSASEKKLFRNVFEEGDCWFNSGDLMRAQGAGHVQFLDRVGDTYRWNGENVATTEVEAVINTWPQTEDAVVYGVQVPGRDGRCGMICYTLKEGESLDAAGFASMLREKLPKYAVPRFMRIRQGQDLTGTFKHQKAKLKKEGYCPAVTDEQLWYLSTEAQAWQPLTLEQKKAIDRGEVRL